MLFGPWLPAYLKPMNTHPTLGEGQNGKIYISGPDPFPPPHNKRERVCYARLVSEESELAVFLVDAAKMGCAPPVDVSGPLSSSLSGTSMDVSGTVSLVQWMSLVLWRAVTLVPCVFNLSSDESLAISLPGTVLLYRIYLIYLCKVRYRGRLVKQGFLQVLNVCSH